MGGIDIVFVECILLSFSTMAETLASPPAIEKERQLASVPTKTNSPFRCCELVRSLGLAQHSIVCDDLIVHCRMTVVNPELARIKRVKKIRPIRALCFDAMVIPMIEFFNNHASGRVPSFTEIDHAESKMGNGSSNFATMKSTFAVRSQKG